MELCPSFRLPWSTSAALPLSSAPHKIAVALPACDNRLPVTLPSSISAETRTAAFDHSPETPANSLSTQIPAETRAPSPHARSSTALRRPAPHHPAKSFHSPAENNPDTPETRPVAASR